MAAWSSSSALLNAVRSQVGRAHLPFMAEHLQDGARIPAQSPFLFRSADAPHRMEAGNHPRREKHRRASRELGIVDPAAADDLVLQRPGEGRFGVLLHVTRQHRVAAAADRHVERRPRPAAVGHAGGKTDLLNETLGVERAGDRPRFVAPPALVAVLFDFLWNLRRRSHLRGR
jgi:hypothetical protein